MAVVELRNAATFDGAAFAEFLDAQPDLGTKWAPVYVRVTERIPLTGTGKVDRKSLRADRWQTTDAVWWRRGRAHRYTRVTVRDLRELGDEFEAAGRAHLLS
jgi:fatty-acyl-CoA synthase